MPRARNRVDEWRNLTPRQQRLFQLWETFLAAYAAVDNRLEHALSNECDLSLAWYDVLFQLNRAPQQRLFMHQLAKAVLLTKSGLTRRVERIESAGLIRRETHDRRSTYIVLTDAGKSMLERALPVAQRVIRHDFVACIEADEIEPFFAGLTRIAQHAQSSKTDSASVSVRP